MSKWGLRVFVLITVGLLVTSSVSAVPLAHADSTSPWISTAPKLETLKTLPTGELPPYSMSGNRDCRTSPTPVRANDAGTSCVIDTAYGTVSQSVYNLRRNGTEYYGELQHPNMAHVTLVPVPGSSTLLYATSAYAGSARYMQLVDNANEHIKSNAILPQNLVVHTLDTQGVPLADKSGQNIPLYYDSIAFSRNGEWMVADSINFGLVRVNMTTKEIVQFSRSYNYDIGLNPSPQTAISEDGRYAAVGSFSQSSFNVFDLSTCGSMPNKLVYSAQVTRCQSVGILPMLNEKINGFLGVSRLRFVGNDSVVFYSTSQVGAVRTTAQQVVYTGDKAGYSGLQYLALGDSFSSGEGAYNYRADTDITNNRCHLSLSSYPYLLALDAGLSSMRSVACSGAVIDDLVMNNDYYNKHLAQSKDMSDDSFDSIILGGFLPGYRSQTKFMNEYQPGIVTLTAGGNDIGFADIIERCASYDTCYNYYEDRAELAKLVQSKFDHLTGLYTQLKDSVAGNSRIYVAGYPKVAVSGGNCALNVHLNNDEILFANQLTDFLNATIRQAAANVGVFYVDTTDALAGHRLCETTSNNVAVNGLTAGNSSPSWLHGPFGSESYHPNALGQQLLANAFIVQTAGLSAPMPTPNSAVVAPAITSNLPLLQAPQAHRGGNIAYFTVPDEAPFVAGTSVGLNISIPTPLAPVPAEVWINSDPVKIGDVTPAADGTLSTNVAIPVDIEPGFHTIHVYGKNVLGKPMDAQMVVYVASSSSDYDSDGAVGDFNACPGFVTQSVDYDGDGINDACDGVIGDAPPKDTTAPVVTGLPDRQPNASGWYDDAVVIAWESNDPGVSSGTPTIPQPTAATSEGLRTYTSEVSCDPAGNCSTGQVTIGIDTTDPAISDKQNVTPNDRGWLNSDVTVGFDCQDLFDGVADEINASGVASCSEPVSVTTEGEHNIRGIVSDNAGNTAETTRTIRLDTTAPRIAHITDRTPNHDGWFNGPVRVSFGCSDDLSGVLSCSDPVDVTQQGGSIVTGRTVDAAGNTSEVNVFVLIDDTAPAITAYSLNPPNANGWNNTDVVVGFTCSDELSGLQECSDPVTITGEGADLTASGLAADTAGNNAETTLSGIRIDKTASQIGGLSFGLPVKATFLSTTLTAPVGDGLSGVCRAEYFVGETDPGEGNGAMMQIQTPIASSKFATVGVGADFPVGVYRFSVRAQDCAGNWSGTTSDYLVVYAPDDDLRLTGKKALDADNLTETSTLPWVLPANTGIRATFGLNVKYTRKGEIANNSDLQLSVVTATGRADHKKHGVTRHSFELDARTIDWFTTEGEHSSTGVFHGTAMLSVDNGNASSVQFVAYATDGRRKHALLGEDRLRVVVFREEADPFVDAPIYTIDARVGRGSIRLNRED